MSAKVEDQVDPVFLAMSKLRRGYYDECIDICTNLLAENPRDKAVWFIKTRALTLADYIERRASDGGLTDWTVCLKSTGKSKSRRIIRDKSIGTGKRKDHSGEDRPMRSTYVTKSIIGSADESIDLDKNELESATKRAEKQGRTKPYGPDFRYARPPERGLLIFSTLNDDHGIEIDEQPYVSYCLSFPDDLVTGGDQVSYYVNSVWQKYE
mgnify:CR=1 FL=1